jgi:hypothetical protein
MHTSNANQEKSSIGSGWYLLGDYPLSLFMPGYEKGDRDAFRPLSQTIKEWGLPVECAQNLERILRNIIEEALPQFRSGKADLPGRIRVFIQMKMIGQEMKGGWGYFVIERSKHAAYGDWIEPLYDFYIYGEGE